MQYLADKALKRCKSVYQAKGHNHVLEVLIVAPKVSLLFVALLDVHAIIHVADVKYGIILGAREPIKCLPNLRQMYHSFHVVKLRFL